MGTKGAWTGGLRTFLKKQGGEQGEVGHEKQSHFLNLWLWFSWAGLTHVWGVKPLLGKQRSANVSSTFQFGAGL